jgi:hypothetical protein
MTAPPRPAPLQEVPADEVDGTIAVKSAGPGHVVVRYLDDCSLYVTH